jgi:uncharacterized protein (DUF2062 family)
LPSAKRAGHHDDIRKAALELTTLGGDLIIPMRICHVIAAMTAYSRANWKNRRTV